MNPKACAVALERDLVLSAVARAIRNDCSVAPASKRPSCEKQISVSLFFDGTNNNAERDQKRVANPNQRSHTNVVVLFDACKDDPENGYYKFYVPGVGTAFPEIGEPGESDAGKAYGWGGESRIYWAMIQVLNAMSRSITNTRLVEPDQAGKDVKSFPLYQPARTDANYLGQIAYFTPLLKQLQTKFSNISRPTLTEVQLNVFGFSRGAAQARAFCNFMDKLCDKDGKLAGVMLRFQFVGLFDTVASVGVADAAPGFQGFGGYASGTMDIPASVQRCTHYVAGHEKRQAFPLSSVRSAKQKGYPGNCVEVVYPGSHSDVGGGYGAGSQGRSLQGRSALLSQVPLRHMYAEARTYGVPLLSVDELLSKSDGLAVAKDLELHSDLSMAFNAYHAWYARPFDVPQSPNSHARWYDQGSLSVEFMLERHVDCYFQWRCITGHDRNYFAASSSYRNASAQEREDLWSSNAEFQREAFAGQKKKAYLQTDAERNLVREMSRTPPPAAVHAFFDRYLHDSHASFYMFGPLTDEDRKAAISKARLKAKQVYGSTVGPNKFERALAAPGVTVQNFPPMQDADTQDIADAKGLKESILAKAGYTTRREQGPFIRYRHVFDDSRSGTQKLFSEADDSDVKLRA